jgi:hypothetical protein
MAIHLLAPALPKHRANALTRIRRCRNFSFLTFVDVDDVLFEIAARQSSDISAHPRARNLVLPYWTSLSSRTRIKRTAYLHSVILLCWSTCPALKFWQRAHFVHGNNRPDSRRLCAPTVRNGAACSPVYRRTNLGKNIVWDDGRADTAMLLQCSRRLRRRAAGMPSIPFGCCLCAAATPFRGFHPRKKQYRVSLLYTFVCTCVQ